MIVKDGHITVAVEPAVRDAEAPAVRMVSGSVPAPAGELDGPRRAVVEYYRAIAGLPQRALLGGTWQPDASGSFRVEVAAAGLTLTTTETWCQTPLGRSFIPGLADEFTDAVLESVLQQARQSGVLRVDRAAYHPVDSSRVGFRAAAALLMAVLLVDDPDGVEAAVRAAIASIRDGDPRPSGLGQSEPEKGVGG